MVRNKLDFGNRCWQVTRPIGMPTQEIWRDHAGNISNAWIVKMSV